MKRHDPARYDQAVREKGTREKQVVQITLPRGTKDKYDKAPTIQVDRNGAASTTTDPNVANRWGASNERIVLRAHIPRSRR